MLSLTVCDFCFASTVACADVDQGKDFVNFVVQAADLCGRNGRLHLAYCQTAMADGEHAAFEPSNSNGVTSKHHCRCEMSFSIIKVTVERPASTISTVRNLRVSIVDSRHFGSRAMYMYTADCVAGFRVTRRTIWSGI